MKENPLVKDRPKPIFLKDYTPPDFLIDHVDLTFDLDPKSTEVTAELAIRRNPAARSKTAPLFLNGGKLNLKTLSLNGLELETAAYEKTPEGLEIPSVPEQFTLKIVNTINPTSNTSLEGLYQSESLLCTQNEPEGFRNITYFIDRPDVMARYRTKMIADKRSFPVLLSNGNLIDRGDLGNGKHMVQWEDPFPKPSYLFALVAGDLGKIEDHFTTRSGRSILLEIYCDRGNEDKCSHAMDSLKKSMKWDEEVFGLEYDLDRFMIVAVSAFNMGAMENKGLNIFNASCVLADPSTATDTDFQRIETIIAHEYFHNWTGNRVTCRDWFQLTLKEGLTVFRDQKFSQMVQSAASCRIDEANLLRNFQFAEDSGPMSHPIQPQSYIEINNFYTSTVYNKGAEVIRMIETLVGEDQFKMGITTYFDLFDGQAVTTEDFIHAMEKASGRDLSQFRLWYRKAGTPEVHAHWKTEDDRFQLTLKQDVEAPFLMPIRFALFDRKGKTLKSEVLELNQKEQTFVFENAQGAFLPSLNRGFSAPVKLFTDYTDDDFSFLMQHETDSFNRWDAAQELAKRELSRLIELMKSGKKPAVSQLFLEAFKSLLNDSDLEPHLKALALGLPSELELAQSQKPYHVESTHNARELLLTTFAAANQDTFLTLYKSLHSDRAYTISAEEVGKRALKNRCLAYLSQLKSQESIDLCLEQLHKATNMTDEINGLALLAQHEIPERDQALNQFCNKWREDQLVMNKWLASQAGSKAQDTLARIQSLIDHSAFSYGNPNAIRALLGVFSRNPVHFHKNDGSGYRFMSEQILKVDRLNPLASAGLMSGFKQFRLMDGSKQALMREELEKMVAVERLSKQLYEVASKCLEA